MRYLIRHGDVRKSPSTVVTNDGVIVWASHALVQWEGKRLLDLIGRYCVDGQYEKGSSVLRKTWELVGQEALPPETDA